MSNTGLHDRAVEMRFRVEPGLVEAALRAMAPFCVQDDQREPTRPGQARLTGTAPRLTSNEVLFLLQE